MNLFRFTKFRRWIFAFLLFCVFGLPIVLGPIGFLYALFLINIPAHLIPGMRYQEFGAMPSPAGYVFIIGFWILVAFVASWPANLVKDKSEPKGS
jgi:hypothetical protein